MTDELKKIGLFGGTFDPIHIGHLLLAEAAYDKFGLDRVLFMPSPLPYHRAEEKITPLSDRIKMTQLAIEGNDHFEFTDFEINLPGETYTSKTLEAFHEKYPDAKLYFIAGGDCLFSIEYWKNPERIFELAVILSGKRQGQQRGATGIFHPEGEGGLDRAPAGAENTNDGLDEKIKDLRERFGAEIYNLYVPDIEISSSDIKARIRDGMSIRYCTPDRVADYIYGSGLYSER